MEIKNRKVASFRAHIDPAIGPKPRNAFDKRELKDWEFEICPIGICVTALFQVPGSPVQVSEHIIPFANIQSIKLEPATTEDAAQKK